MATIKRFEDLEIWQIAMELSNEITKIINSTGLKTDFSLRDQIDRSSMSISDNIAEGFERGGNREFIHFLSIAKASCGETRSQLYKVINRNYIEQNQLEELVSKTEMISKKINTFVNYLNKNDFKGNKFKNSSLDKQTQSVNSKPETSNLKPQTTDSANSSALDYYYAHPTAVIDEGCTIGEGTKIWHFSHIMSNCVIGEKCNLGQNVVVSPGVILGKNVKVQNNVSIYTGVKCEDDVFLGPSMVFTNVINPRSAVNRRDQYSETIVGKGASIGANATIVCGNPIGEYALIGAGAVVTKPIKPYALVVGNPSKQIGWVSEYGHRLHFDENGKATCEESGQEYQLENENVTRIK